MCYFLTVCSVVVWCSWFRSQQLAKEESFVLKYFFGSTQCFVSFRFISFSFLLFCEGCGMLPLFIPLKGCGAYWGQIQFHSWVKARVHPEWVASSLQDPYWWQWLPRKVPTAHQEQFWGSVSCSGILRHVAQSNPRVVIASPLALSTELQHWHPIGNSMY